MSGCYGNHILANKDQVTHTEHSEYDMDSNKTYNNKLLGRKYPVKQRKQEVFSKL